MQLVRGVLYYFSEELPCIPADMQAEWFDTEVRMVERACEAAQSLIDAFKE